MGCERGTRPSTMMAIPIQADAGSRTMIARGDSGAPTHQARGLVQPLRQCVCARGEFSRYSMLHYSTMDSRAFRHEVGTFLSEHLLRFDRRSRAKLADSPPISKSTFSPFPPTRGIIARPARLVQHSRGAGFLASDALVPDS